MWIELHKVSGVNAGAFSAKLKPVKLQPLGHRRGPARRISLGQAVVVVLLVLHLVRCF